MAFIGGFYRQESEILLQKFWKLAASFILESSILDVRLHIFPSRILRRVTFFILGLNLYRVVFLTGPPDFQYQNEKQVAANQD